MLRVFLTWIDNHPDSSGRHYLPDEWAEVVAEFKQVFDGVEIVRFWADGESVCARLQMHPEDAPPIQTRLLAMSHARGFAAAWLITEATIYL